MSSNDLEKLVVGGMFLSVILLLISVIFLQIKLKKILKGKNAEDLEDTLKNIEREYRAMKNFRDAMSRYLKIADERIKRSVQAVETVKFNPWKGTGEGGNQSFASALVSEKGDGLIISSLYSRDRLSVYAKPIEEGKCRQNLTDEEKKALDNALIKIRDKQSINTEP